MPDPTWRLPLDRDHALARSAGALTFVGGAGDFDAAGRIRRPGDLLGQLAGALENADAALAGEGCSLADAVRVKVLYLAAGELDEWDLLAAAAAGLPAGPLPVISLLPALQPFADQLVQVQVIAVRGWRAGADVRVAEHEAPASHRDRLPGGRVTGALRAGELIATASRTAAWPGTAVPPGLDAPAQSHLVMESLEADLRAVGASLQDAVKMEGYYLGTSLGDWAPLAHARASHFREPGPVATVVPAAVLRPDGAHTRIEVLAMRERRATFDKYVARDDSWPDHVWDWPIELPYRQGLRLRGTAWLGGQVPWEHASNSGAWEHPGDDEAQIHLTMTYVDEILAGFGLGAADLSIGICYFQGGGTPAETATFVERIAGWFDGPLPPLTLVPMTHLHGPESCVEIWGVAAAADS